MKTDIQNIIALGFISIIIFFIIALFIILRTDYNDEVTVDPLIDEQLDNMCWAFCLGAEAEEYGLTDYNCFCYIDDELIASVPLE